MKAKDTYSIGEMSKICNISKKTLRYYDAIGLIPSQRQDYNNYRYYTYDALLMIPVLKYYKQMGFKLSELSEIIYKDIPNAYAQLKKCFASKMEEISIEQESLRRKNISIQDWYKLISEAEMVIENNLNDISVKYLAPIVLLYQDQVSENDSKSNIINIQWTNYLEQIENEITGPVIICYASFADRMNDGIKQNIRIMQQSILPPQEGQAVHFGDCLMLSCYHIGPHDTIMNVYTRMEAWAAKHNYILGKEVYERYVTDYWTSCNCANFVTEIMIKISRQKNIEQ